MSKDLIPLPELSCRAGQSYIATWGDFARGKLPAIRIKGRLFVERAAAEKYLSALRANGRKAATSAA